MGNSQMGFREGGFSGYLEGLCIKVVDSVVKYHHDITILRDNPKSPQQTHHGLLQNIKVREIS